MNNQQQKLGLYAQFHPNNNRFGIPWSDGKGKGCITGNNGDFSLPHLLIADNVILVDWIDNGNRSSPEAFMLELWISFWGAPWISTISCSSSQPLQTQRTRGSCHDKGDGKKRDTHQRAGTKAGSLSRNVLSFWHLGIQTSLPDCPYTARSKGKPEFTVV